jgi:hypothetical protein
MRGWVSLQPLHITTNFQRFLESGLESIPLAGQDLAPNDPHLHRNTP